MPFGPFSPPFSFTTTTVPAPTHTPSPTLAELRQAIYDFVSGCLPSGWKAIFERQNAPRPSDETPPSKYVTIFLSPLIKPNLRDFQGGVQQLDTDVFAVEMVGDRELTVTLQAFGKGGIQVLEDLRTCLDVESVLEALRSDNLFVIQALGIQDLTGLYDSQYLERGSLDVRFRTHARVLDQEASYIEVVEGEETFKHPPKPDIVRPFSVDLTP
jgi:hypothetical protein